MMMTKGHAAVDEGKNPRSRLADRRVVAIHVSQFALAGRDRARDRRHRYLDRQSESR